MKIIRLSIAVALMTLAVSLSQAGERNSFGLGVGSIYSGLGANYGFIRGDAFSFLSIGCIALGYSETNGLIAPCGPGAGWIKTNLIGENNKHGIGIYVGPIAANEGSTLDKDKTVYGIGMPYVFFFKEDFAPGWNIGITPVVGHWDGKTKGGVILQLGYQY